jgi:hypothetical protein
LFQGLKALTRVTGCECGGTPLRGGRPGIKNPGGVNIDHAEFPADWFAGLAPERYRARRYDKRANKYGVVSGQGQAAWEESGWIIDQDPRWGGGDSRGRRGGRFSVR